MLKTCSPCVCIQSWQTANSSGLRELSKPGLEYVFLALDLHATPLNDGIAAAEAPHLAWAGLRSWKARGAPDEVPAPGADAAAPEGGFDDLRGITVVRARDAEDTDETEAEGDRERGGKEGEGKAA